MSNDTIFTIFFIINNNNFNILFKLTSYLLRCIINNDDRETMLDPKGHSFERLTIKLSNGAHHTPL